VGGELRLDGDLREEDDGDDGYDRIQVGGEPLCEHLVVDNDGGEEGEEAAGEVPREVLTRLSSPFHLVTQDTMRVREL